MAHSTNPKVQEAEHSQEQSFNELFGILSYNQGLVEFADSKAGSLILLNSLLIAAVGTLSSDGHMGTLKLISVVLSSAAVYFCFQVISSKGPVNDGPGSSDDPQIKKPRSCTGWQANDFVFFDCISGHKSGQSFVQAFLNSDPSARSQAILQRTHIIAGIAQRKFTQYRQAQQMTSLALGVWVVVNLIPFLGHMS